MDLVVLLGRVPCLLEACVGSHVPTLRNMQLVSKKAGRVALLGLTDYRLCLRGAGAYNRVCGTKLLAGTRLQMLACVLKLSGTRVGTDERSSESSPPATLFFFNTSFVLVLV